MFVFPGDITSDRVENKIFWPLITASALACLVSRKGPRLAWPPHIITLAAYVVLAGASVLWAFKPEVSLSRFVTEVMLLISTILPAMLASRKSDMMRGVFLCFALGAAINAALILGGYSVESVADNLRIGYPGYFAFKGMLGEFAALAVLLSIYEIILPGRRRVWGFIVLVISGYLIFMSESKGSLGCALLAAILATLVMFVSRKLRVSPALVLLPLPICYAILSRMVGDLINRISWYIYGNYTVSGRVFIWNFVDSEIAKRPLLGWGYRSFWLVGPDSPALVDAGGWVKTMPSAHNGYLETILDTGYIGLIVFIIFLFTTLHAIGRVTGRDPTRAWLLLSIALFVALVNFIEAGWMRGGDTLWLMFVIVVAESGRYWNPAYDRLRAAGGILQNRAISQRRPFVPRAGWGR
jgi:exopolysaccharide production protein ExoQ